MPVSLLNQGYVECGQSDGFCQHIGPFYENNALKPVTRALTIDNRHLNPEGVVNGGVILSFMDYIIYRAIGDEIGHEIKFATINLNSNFLAAAKFGNTLYGTGSIVRKTRDVIFAEGLIVTAERKIMTASGIWKIIGGN
ncbi:PaaI family thioesterase [Thalassotalea piscium]